ncbi:MAG TPA: DUF4383 domain-containing protein [Solirubrobacterales bacterium]|nr:DUF4383 domain-containing protein [Solirubrobacterales bacterium]
MEAPSPARLYAAAVGAVLFVLGLLGFFYTASFDGLGDYEEALGTLPMNGWLNLLYVAAGALGLLAAEIAPRRYALAAGLLFTVLAIVGWGSDALNLIVGLLGLAAVAGTAQPGRKKRHSKKRGSKVTQEAPKEPRRSKPRAKPAGKRA